MTDEYHPELAGYEPDEGRPVRRASTQHLMRIVVIVGILGLVLPGVVISIATADHTANVACAAVVAQDAPGSVSSERRFELLGAGGPGWYCYAQSFDGTETLLRYLGLIPEAYTPVGTRT